jgi:N-methylhydantoinase A
MAAHVVVGIDVGGTFTDILALDRTTGQLRSAKVPSLPGRQWAAILSSLAAMGLAFADIALFVHGTTIATNAVLERKLVPTAFITTRGFRDTLEIGKTRRLTGGLFDFRFVRPAPVAERRHRYELDERLAADGTRLQAFAPAALTALAATLAEEGIEAVAIGFVNSYLDDSEEQRAKALLQALAPHVAITASAEVARERGEYERFSTAVLNAGLMPVIGRYLDGLEDALRPDPAASAIAPVHLMGSNGGTLTIPAARRFPVRTFLSGPVGGVIGAQRVAALAGFDRFISFDMGGTSTDVALIDGALPRMAHEKLVEAFPVSLPHLDIHTIGAGGGSIASRRVDGALEVGPQSAGAMPGPACYQRGGLLATISDANLLLGRLDARRKLGGALALSLDLAREAFQRLAAELGERDILALAEGVIRLAVMKMAGAVREVSVHQGEDPRDYPLLGFGGAGPMHVFLVAEELDIGTVLIPRFPGHLSALGQLFAPYRIDLVRPRKRALTAMDEAALDDLAATLAAEAGRTAQQDGLTGDLVYSFAADLRYIGQSFTLPVPVPEGGGRIAALRDGFNAAHHSVFGHARPDHGVELVNLRLVATQARDAPRLEMGALAAAAPPTIRAVYWHGAWHDSAVYERETLPPGARIAGPAIINEPGGTTVLPPGWRAEVEPSGSLVCRSRQGGADHVIDLA